MSVRNVNNPCHRLTIIQHGLTAGWRQGYTNWIPFNPVKSGRAGLHGSGGNLRNHSLMLGPELPREGQDIGLQSSPPRHEVRTAGLYYQLRACVRDSSVRGSILESDSDINVGYLDNFAFSTFLLVSSWTSQCMVNLLGSHLLDRQQP